AVEHAGRDGSVVHAARRNFDRLEQALREVIEEGQRDGSFRADRDPVRLARTVQSAYYGLRLLSKVSSDRAALLDVVDGPPPAPIPGPVPRCEHFEKNNQKLTPPKESLDMPLAIYVLGLATFAMTSSEFMVAGILPELSEGLGVSVSAIGYLVSAFAVAMAVG